ncbi:HNH endonuclease [Nocardia sp. NPDC004750]
MAARNTTTRDRDRAYIRRQRPACGICQGEIDYSLHYLDPGAFVVDHIVPLARGGADTRDNKQAAHRHCNRQKSDKLEDEMSPAQPIRTFVTDRTW